MIKVISVIIWFGIGALVGFNLCVLSVVLGSTYVPLLNTCITFGCVFGGLRLGYFLGWVEGVK